MYSSLLNHFGDFLSCITVADSWVVLSNSSYDVSNALLSCGFWTLFIHSFNCSISNLRNCFFLLSAISCLCFRSKQQETGLCFVNNELLIFISLKRSRSSLLTKNKSITLLPYWNLYVTSLISLTQWRFQLIKNSQSELPLSDESSLQLKSPPRTIRALPWQHWKASLSAWYIVSRSVFGGKNATIIIRLNSLICNANSLLFWWRTLHVILNCLLSAIAKPLCGRPFPLFIAFVQKHVKPGISTEFTLRVSVNSKISYAIASLVHVDSVPLAPSTFHKQIVSHDPLFSTIWLPLILYLVEGFSSLFSFNSATIFFLFFCSVFVRSGSINTYLNRSFSFKLFAFFRRSHFIFSVSHFIRSSCLPSVFCLPILWHSNFTFTFRDSAISETRRLSDASVFSLSGLVPRRTRSFERFFCSNCSWFTPLTT